MRKGRKINEKIGDIQSSSSLLMKEKDQGKVASAIEHAIYNTAVIISIPPEVVAPTMPSTIIINKNDFKTPLYRSQLSEHYRELAEKKKGNKALIKYYTFLINTLEVDYPKYLNKKIR